MKAINPNNKPVFLIIDDQHRSFRSLSLRVVSEHFQAVWADNIRNGLKILKKFSERVALILIDLKVSELGGGGFIQRSRGIAPRAAILLTTPLGPILYRNGDFYNLEQLNLKNHINAILDALFTSTESKVSDEGSQRSALPVNQNSFGEIIGGSPELNAIYRQIEKLRSSNATVLISGESGTGKELIARAIHRVSGRGEKPFVPLNCGAIPAELMESELFGHERGAFTGAHRQRMGKFELADKGTLFLDEIADLNGSLQVKLLRLLQEGEFARVGGNDLRKADVRFIAATNQNLKQAVEAGIFREDLYYRLNVIQIHMPPLRERREDISDLLSHFTKQLADQIGRPEPAYSSEAYMALLDYSYPGNVRELINIVERIMIMSTGNSVTCEDLPEEIWQQRKQRFVDREVLAKLPKKGIRLAEVEKELILKTLALTGGNKMAAAKSLGITRRLLYLRLDQYGIKPGAPATPGYTFQGAVT